MYRLRVFLPTILVFSMINMVKSGCTWVSDVGSTKKQSTLHSGSTTCTPLIRRKVDDDFSVTFGKASRSLLAVPLYISAARRFLEPLSFVLVS